MNIANRVLVASDLSDSSPEALRQANAYALSVDGMLGVCHVLPSAGVEMLFPQRYAKEAAQAAAMDERVRTLVGSRVMLATARAPTSFDVFVEHGTAYAEIVRLAEAWRARLIVVGSHRRSDALLGRLLGGVAENVARYAHCPVLVARAPAGSGVVLCATDLSAPSLPVLAAAATEARLRGAKLEILHVVDQGVPLARVSASEGITPLVLCPELLHDLRESARAQMDAALVKLEVQAVSTIVEGHAATTILKYVEEHRPELVVVGTRGRTGLARILLGSVAEHVVRSAATAVLVVRLHP